MVNVNCFWQTLYIPFQWEWFTIGIDIIMKKMKINSLIYFGQIYDRI